MASARLDKLWCFSGCRRDLGELASEAALTEDSVLTSPGSPGLASATLCFSGCREIFWAMLFLGDLGELASEAAPRLPE